MTVQRDAPASAGLILKPGCAGIFPVQRLVFVPFRAILFLCAVTILRLPAFPADTVDSSVPSHAPRTGVLGGRAETFRDYCKKGEGAKAFSKIKLDFDRDYLVMPFPVEPLTYGDPSARSRDSAKTDEWRKAQDVCGRVSGVAEAATLLWMVTAEEKYFLKAKEFLLKSCEWHFAPDWRSGSVPGATDIEYNTEANFRLWRKLPSVYDQLRDKLTADERAKVLAHFKERGARTVRFIKATHVGQLRRNSIEVDPSSHAVRFMAMTGVAGLALWDDLPEAREWWRFAYDFYRDQFSPWGGDDGGWAEGSAYWRGTMEHAVFQDALFALGDPSAYNTPFWKNSSYFVLYNVQPYLHTVFGDTSNAGRFNLEPAMSDYLEHLARIQQNGFFASYAALCVDASPFAEHGLGNLNRAYPTACERLVRNFIVAEKKLPPPEPLNKLPSHRFFRDVGWVSMHSSLGQPGEDIQITFKSSQYGSFSHSHADQNAFILNAFGESLAINSAYREYHRSPFHQQWTWQTKSKNAILIDGIGQKPQDKFATGKIIRCETIERAVWATGDATVAYQSGQTQPGRVRRVTRDVVFVDSRYAVLRDRVSLASPGKISWLLHAEKNLSWDGANNRAVIRGAQGRATLAARLVAPEVRWRAEVTERFPLPLDSKYSEGESGDDYVTGEWSNQIHLTLESTEAARDFTVFAVLWPDRNVSDTFDARLVSHSTLEITRPDGGRDFVTVTDDSCRVASTLPSR